MVEKIIAQKKKKKNRRRIKREIIISSVHTKHNCPKKNLQYAQNMQKKKKLAQFIGIVVVKRICTLFSMCCGVACNKHANA